jgi:hypothetical protein
VSDAPPHYERQAARRSSLYARELKSDNTVNCYSATLTGLRPGATYRYRVGSPERDAWSDYHSFTTAPDSPMDAFSFVYFGDTQAYPERFAQMLEDVWKKHSEAAFYMIGGDMVNRGDQRNLWDSLLIQTEKVFARKVLAPAMGNHDFGRYGIGEKIFSSYFTLPASASSRSGSSLNYSFEYGSAYFIVINAKERNLRKQTAWLEEQLGKAESYAFKVLMLHFPVYNPLSGRTNSVAQEQWVPLLDKYGVDLVLTGHDHSYMRSKPMRAGKQLPQGESGTTYVVATGSEKFYPFQELDYAERQFSNVATYQLISVAPEAGGQLVLSYSAHAPDGELLDEFYLRKAAPPHYSDEIQYTDTSQAAPLQQ